jgi:hypothetical protein
VDVPSNRVDASGLRFSPIQAGHLPATSAEPASCGIDLLIERKDLVGQGLGPAIVDTFVTNYVFGKTPAEVCTGDPDAGNGRSILASEKSRIPYRPRFHGSGRPSPSPHPQSL